MGTIPIAGRPSTNRERKMYGNNMQKGDVMTHFTRNGLAGLMLASVSFILAPLVQAQSWSPRAGDFQGGYVRGLTVPSLFNATATGDAWAAIYYGGMFKRAPGSSTWTPMNTGLTDKRVRAFTVHTGVNPYRAYAATSGGGMYKTTDGGANWTAINSGLGCVYVQSIQTFFGANESTDRLLASTSCGSASGVYVSNDGGANWTQTSGMTPGVSAINTTRVNPGGSGVDFMLAATYEGIYKSTDSGLNWTLANGNITNPNGSSPNIHNVTYLYNGNPAALTLYAAEQNTGVWKSSDQGVTWALVLNKITTAAGIGTDGWGNGNLYYPVDGEGVYKSADQGATWTLFASAAALPGARGVQRNTTILGSPIYYAQTYAGVYQSADGGLTWHKDSAGLPGGYAINLASDSSGNVYVAAMEGVYKKPPSGGTFQRLGGYNLGYFGSGGHMIVTPADVPYVITSNLGVFKYDGTNWVAKNAGLPTMTRQGGSLRVDPNNANGLYLGLSRSGMYYSADGGETWTAKNSGLSDYALKIRHMAVTAAVALISTNDGIYKSTNGGATWTRLAFAAMSPAATELPIDRLRIDSGNGNIYAAVYQTSAAGVTYPGSGIWKSTDGGTSWTQSLAGKRTHDISVARSASGVTLYAGVWDAVDGGALQSTDEGATWTAINAGLSSYYIGSFGTPNSKVNVLGVATLGAGVFAYTPPVLPESLSIIAGWNLVGNGMGTPLTVATAFADASKVNTVWKWLPASVNWAFYTPTLPDGGAAYAAGKGYALLSSIAAGEGFWVNAKSGFTLPLAGTAVTSASFQTGLASGWNLIATGEKISPSAFNRALNVTPPQPDVVPLNLTTLWAWDAALAGWYFYAPSLEASGGLAAYISSKSYLDFGAKTLGATTGFWVNKP